jgi:hypothetical protein
MSVNFFSLNPIKTEFSLIGHPKQLSILHYHFLILSHFLQLNLLIILLSYLIIIFLSLNTYLLFSNSCLYHIHDIRHLRSIIDQSAARIIATALTHYKLDCCNSLLLNLPASHLNHLQLVLNSAAHAVTRTSKFGHVSPILKDLWAQN